MDAQCESVANNARVDSKYSLVGMQLLAVLAFLYSIARLDQDLTQTSISHT